MTTHLRWPPEQFYWAVLEAPQWKRPGALPPGIAAALEEDLPVPIESVHAVGAPLGDGRLLVCAVDRARLSDADPNAITLRPESIPAFVEGGTSVAADLNLLVGRFEPRSIRRARALQHVLAAAALLLIAALASVGLVRRTSVWETAAREAAAGRVAVITDGSSPDALSMEVDRLNRLKESSGQVQPPLDAAATLATLLTVWPATVSSHPQSLAVSSSGISASVSVDGDPTPFLSAFRAPAGWTLEEPRLNRADKLTRVTLQMKPKAPRAAERTP